MLARVLGKAELEHEQRDGDCEDAVAKRLEASERQLVLDLDRWGGVLRAQAGAGRGRTTTLSARSRITEAIDMMIAARIAVQKKSSMVR